MGQEKRERRGRQKGGEENYRREGEQKEREESEGKNEDHESIFYLLVLSGSLIDSLAPPTPLVYMGSLHSVC